MTNFKLNLINDILEKEGGYVNDPRDSGGATMFGITERVARAYGYRQNMIDMPLSFAISIYSHKYFDVINFDSIEHLSEKIAGEVADTAVNMGTKRAGIFLQRALNVLNKNQALYNDLVVDGSIGSETIKALRAYFSRRGRKGEDVLFKMLNSLQGAFYVTLAERRTKDERFIFGWFSNRVA